MLTRMEFNKENKIEWNLNLVKKNVKSTELL